MYKSHIEYLEYQTNPIVGCSGKGCAVVKHCWAAKQAKRNKHECDACYSFVPHVHWERFDDFLSVKKPCRIGVAFMGEFFDDEIDNWVRKDYYMHMLKAPQHTFVILTKQPQNIDDEPLPDNLWVGVSVNRKEDFWRLNLLRDAHVELRIANFEPLYEDLGEVNLEKFGWIILGAQTRPDIQPKPEWVYSLSHQASKLGIPVFWKRNLKYDNPRQEYPRDR